MEIDNGNYNEECIFGNIDSLCNNDEPLKENDNVLPESGEILKAVCSEGTYLSVLQTLDGEDGISKTFLDVPVEIEKHSNVMQVNIMGGGITEIYEILYRHSKAMDELSMEGNSNSGILFIFIPEKYLGEFVFGCNDPVFWALTAAKPGALADRISMAFLPYNVGIFTVGEEDVENEKQ